MFGRFYENSVKKFSKKVPSFDPISKTKAFLWIFPSNSSQKILSDHEKYIAYFTELLPHYPYFSYFDVIKEKKIASIIAQKLKKDKIFFAGIDFVSGYLIGDINVTSPTGLPQLKDLTGNNLAKYFWDEARKLK